jgi:hypothetical protein
MRINGLTVCALGMIFKNLFYGASSINPKLKPDRSLNGGMYEY